MCSTRNSDEKFSNFTFYESKQMSLTQDLKWSLEQSGALYNLLFSTASNWFVTLYYKLLHSVSSSSNHGRRRSSLLLYISTIKAQSLNDKHDPLKISSESVPTIQKFPVCNANPPADKDTTNHDAASVNLCVLNARSVRNKTHVLCDYI